MTVTWWTIVAGRGARYFANTGMVVAILIVMAWLMFPAFSGTSGWSWKLLALTAVGLAAAAVQEFAARDTVRTFAKALAGLNHTQRAEVLKSLRGKVIPTDAGVLATTIRVGAIGQAYDRRYAQKQKGWRWALPALYLFMGAVQLLGRVGEREIHQALLWAGLGVYFGLYYRWLAYRRAQLDRAVAQLRTAAIDVPIAASAAAQTSAPVQIPPRRYWASLLLVAVLGLAFAGAVWAWGEPFPRPKPRAVTSPSWEPCPDATSWAVVLASRK
jgi:hypothetical protein